jgi:hypothetical protein
MEDCGEQRPRHRHLGELKDHVAAMADDPRPDLDQPLAQRRQRSPGDLVRQRQRSVGSSQKL